MTARAARCVANTLIEHGFQVAGDADWQWDKLVLACDVLYVLGWPQMVRSHDREAVELPRFLRAQDPSLALVSQPPNPESVQRKLEDLRTVHPSYTGKPTRGGRATRQVVDAFLAEPERMHDLAQSLAAQGSLARADDGGDDPGLARAPQSSPADYVSAAEGRVRVRLVVVRERNPKLRRTKIE